jgi:glutamate carboxypeptidase
VPDAAKAVRSWILADSDELVTFALRLVECESPSHDARGLECAASLMRDALERVGLPCLRYGPADPTQRCLMANECEPKGRYQLLGGHIDAVWPVSTLSSMRAEVRGGRLTGPGSFDMKGGLAQMVFALGAFACPGSQANT